MPVRLHFVDINPVVADALRHTFSGHPDIEVACADILAVASHCLVSPANSHGFMDGGVDAAYAEFFGPALQTAVQAAILRRPEGMLPVGTAMSVATHHETIPYIILAPTMEMPEAVPALHAGRALRAALRVIDREPLLGQDVYCPGFGTLTDCVAPTEAAESMLLAYEHWLRGKE